jgi:hypothetical protein
MTPGVWVPTKESVMAFDYEPHPRTLEHLEHDLHPPKTTDERVGINGRIGLFITLIVGTMWTAYLFTLIALVSLPDVLKGVGLDLGFSLGNGTVLLVAWISQAFLQLVLLPIIIVGQNIQAKAADKRAESTYKDAEAVLHEALQIQSHLAEQDKQLGLLVTRVGT